MTATQLRKLIDRAPVRSDAEAARILGVTRAHLCDMLAGKRGITDEIAAAAKRLVAQ